MRKNLMIEKTFVREPEVQDWMTYEFAEEDFLLGKKPEFSPDLWEDEE